MRTTLIHCDACRLPCGDDPETPTGYRSLTLAGRDYELCPTCAAKVARLLEHPGEQTLVHVETLAALRRAAGWDEPPKLLETTEGGGP